MKKVSQTAQDQLMRRAIQIAQNARDHGNHPFGALLVSPAGEILIEAENTVVTERDITGHAETNLVCLASKKYDAPYLATCALYTSTEPCPMCAGAIFWANIGAVVYGLSEASLYGLVPADTPHALRLSCRDVFAHGSHEVKVIGPLLEEAAVKVHQGFWTSGSDD